MLWQYCRPRADRILEEVKYDSLRCTRQSRVPRRKAECRGEERRTENLELVWKPSFYSLEGIIKTFHGHVGEKSAPRRKLMTLLVHLADIPERLADCSRMNGQ